MRAAESIVQIARLPAERRRQSRGPRLKARPGDGVQDTLSHLHFYLLALATLATSAGLPPSHRAPAPARARPGVRETFRTARWRACPRQRGCQPAAKPRPLA